MLIGAIFHHTLLMPFLHAFFIHFGLIDVFVSTQAVFVYHAYLIKSDWHGFHWYIDVWLVMIHRFIAIFSFVMHIAKRHIMTRQCLSYRLNLGTCIALTLRQSRLGVFLYKSPSQFLPTHCHCHHRHTHRNAVIDLL